MFRAVASPNQREFIRAVRAFLNVTPTELGDLLGKRNAYNAVNAWETDNRSNFRKLSYQDTIAMLELCGWLPATWWEDATGPRTGVVTPVARPVPQTPTQILEEIRDRLEGFGAVSAKLLRSQALLMDHFGISQPAEEDADSSARTPPSQKQDRPRRKRNSG